MSFEERPDVRKKLARLATMAAKTLELGSDEAAGYWAGVLREVAEEETLTKPDLGGYLRCAADAIQKRNPELSREVNAFVARVSRVGLY